MSSKLKGLLQKKTKINIVLAIYYTCLVLLFNQSSKCNDIHYLHGNKAKPGEKEHLNKSFGGRITMAEIAEIIFAMVTLIIALRYTGTGLT